MKIVVNVHLAVKLADHGRMELFGNGESLSGKIIPKTNLTLSPEFDGCAGKP